MAEAASAQEITITRVYEAPRELVWRAWTEPDRLAQWWGPPGWRTPRENVTMDVRPGGRFRVNSISDEGVEMAVEGTYREIAEPQRIVLEESAEHNWHDGAVSEVTLTDLGDGRTELVIRATIHTSDEMSAEAERGMNGTLDRLAEHLS
jgi:uncharacterized protein YndB with AHSA1/START domain